MLSEQSNKGFPRFRGGETTTFQRKAAKINQTLGLLGHGRENDKKEKR
jgi:hypothetical protein